MIFLGNEEERRPPALEALKGVPCFSPLGLKVEHEDDSFHWILIVFKTFIQFEGMLQKGMNLHILDHNF
jgi:hypothetical protein